MEASALSAPAALTRESGTSPWLRLRSDEQLVGLFRSGSEEAFRVIHDRYRQRLSGYARQMLGGSGADAEDVMQDVFLRAYRALRADERPVSLRAWLYRVAHNRCIDALRRPVPPPADVFAMSRTPTHDPCAEAERREDLQRLVADVRRLPDQQRSALLMREMDGMSYADLAAALDTSVPAVKSLLVRARIGLVEAIEARDADCSDIRHDLAASYDRGVRTTGRARRHLRECAGCTTYRAQLRGLRQGFAALSPGAMAPGLLAKLLGLGGATSGVGAAAGGTVAVGGGSAAAVSVGKVAAVVSAAVLTGGAVEVKKIVDQRDVPAARAARAPGPAGAPAGTPAAAANTAVVIRLRATPAEELALNPPVAMGPTLASRNENVNGSGGQRAPDEATVADSPIATPAPAAVAEEDQAPEHGLPITGEILGVGDEPAAPGGESSSDAPSSGSGTSSSSSSSGSASSGAAAGSGSGAASDGATASSAEPSAGAAPASGSSPPSGS